MGLMTGLYVQSVKTQFESFPSMGRAGAVCIETVGRCASNEELSTSGWPWQRKEKMAKEVREEAPLGRRKAGSEAGRGDR